MHAHTHTYTFSFSICCLTQLMQNVSTQFRPMCVCMCVCTFSRLFSINQSSRSHFARHFPHFFHLSSLKFALEFFFFLFKSLHVLTHSLTLVNRFGSGGIGAGVGGGGWESGLIMRLGDIQWQWTGWEWDISARFFIPYFEDTVIRQRIAGGEGTKERDIDEKQNRSRWKKKKTWTTIADRSVDDKQLRFFLSIVLRCFTDQSFPRKLVLDWAAPIPSRYHERRKI